MSNRLYVDRLDHGAVEHNPLDYRSETACRAEDAYEPNTPERTATEVVGPLIDALEAVLASFGRGARA